MNGTRGIYDFIKFALNIYVLSLCTAYKVKIFCVVFCATFMGILGHNSKLFNYLKFSKSAYMQTIFEYLGIFQNNLFNYDE